MTFEDKVRLLRSAPIFKVTPISEVKAVAFAAKEADTLSPGFHIVGKTPSKLLVLTDEDIVRILRVYPDLEPKLKRT